MVAVEKEDKGGQDLVNTTEEPVKGGFCSGCQIVKETSNKDEQKTGNILGYLSNKWIQNHHHHRRVIRVAIIQQ